MLDLLVSAAPMTPAPQPDWVARGLSLAGMALTVILFIVGQRGKIWRGRRADLTTVTEPLDELRLAMDAVRHDATNAYQLWSVPNSVAIETLQEATDNFPDPRLRAELGRFLQRLAVARGNLAITAEPGEDPPPLKGKQSTALQQATDTLAQIDLRIRKIKRKGSAG